jgi:hypothetical protein
VERKSLADLVASLTGGKLRYALAELAALPRAAVVVEDRYSQVFKLARVRPALVADGLVPFGHGTLDFAGDQAAAPIGGSGAQPDGATITERQGLARCRRGLGCCRVRPRRPTEPSGQGFPAPGAGAGNATTRPVGCAGSGPP